MVTHTIAQKSMCAQPYTKCVCAFHLSQLFISSSQLIKSKIKRHRGNNQKQNHAALEENPRQTDSSGRASCCYVLHTEKATSKTTT